MPPAVKSPLPITIFPIPVVCVVDIFTLPLRPVLQAILNIPVWLPNKKKAPKGVPILIVFDLDNTILNVNTDYEIIDLIKKKSPEKIKERANKENWSFYMNNILDILHKENIKIEEIKKIIDSSPLNIGFKELFQFIESNKSSVL